MGNFLDKLDFYGQLMDFNTLRARVITHNVANLSTPGFKRQEVSFDESLRKAVATGKSSELREVEPEVETVTDGASKPNGNNVFFMKQYALMTKNKIMFEAVAEAAKWKFRLNKTAVTRGDM